ncbi:hypothetical protein KC640_01055 [Candidatus Dojkabacteria bacterium]|uniref:Uncharacterized protein n=1 Tax=Candidatus Dojkabacteria bacterium TaxID=2099670 RepID=A0A955KYQ2_9BACT|nr:hypothetical protein [Candidatus Dojkabacteria bacterium]
MQIIVYSFDSFPWKSELQEDFGEALYLKKLKIGLEQLKKRVLDERPGVVIGIAKASGKQSSIETQTKNQFGLRKPGVILQDGNETYQLYRPAVINIPFKLRHHATATFCNYAAYHLAQFIDQNRLPTLPMFAHVAKAEDLGMLKKMITGDQKHLQDTDQRGFPLV